jgi:hypothetical protein
VLHYARSAMYAARADAAGPGGDSVRALDYLAALAHSPAEEAAPAAELLKKVRADLAARAAADAVQAHGGAAPAPGAV